MSVVDFLTQPVDLPPETREEMSGNPIGQFALIESVDALSTSESTVECPLCREKMHQLHPGRNQCGRIVAEVDETTVLVDVAPAGMAILGCSICNVVFYSGETS